MVIRVILFGVLFFISSTCFASPDSDSIYFWKVIRVIDGDTVEVEASFLPDELKLLVRILGIDTPEKSPKAKCAEEDELAQKASKLTKKLIRNAKVVIFSGLKWDKYGGRVLANVYVDGFSVAQELIDAKLAREYHGEKKQSWCKKG